MRRVVAIALLALAASTSVAAATTPRTTLPRIEQQVMCVVCKTPLSVANGPQADAERRQIRRLIARGYTERQIKDALVAQYGDRVLALPKAKGFNVAVYVIPAALLATGLIVLAVALPRWRRRGSTTAAAWSTAPAGPPPTPEDLRRVQEELDREDA
jgi:cytochrome c-type biogenesis protein CcmH